jgi:hypothetical protein
LQWSLSIPQVTLVEEEEEEEEEEQTLPTICLSVNATRWGDCFHFEKEEVWITLEQEGIARVTAHLLSKGSMLIASSSPAAVRVSSATTYSSGGEHPAPRGITESAPFALTGILPLTLADLGRSALLLRSMNTCGMLEELVSLIIVTKDAEWKAIRGIFEHGYGNGGKIKVLPESLILLSLASTAEATATAVVEGYAVQMLIKLAVAKFVETEFYITLDADVICTASPFSSEQFLFHDESGCVRATYEDEPRHVHPTWWKDSGAFLGIDVAYADKGGFGVTPAVLSATGSLFTLRLLEHRWGPDYEKKVLSMWMSAEGTMWSEYTLYRLALDELQMFDALHEHPSNISAFNVWYSHDLPWQADSAFEDESSAFSVVQSTSGARESDIAKLLESEILKRREKFDSSTGVCS